MKIGKWNNFKIEKFKNVAILNTFYLFSKHVKRTEHRKHKLKHN